MAEIFEYSKTKHEREVLVHAKRKERLQMAVAVITVLLLVAAYVNQTALRWF
jgi:accessory gene regulator protein AgrB